MSRIVTYLAVLLSGAAVIHHSSLMAIHGRDFRYGSLQPLPIFLSRDHPETPLGAIGHKNANAGVDNYPKADQHPRARL